MSVPDVTVVIPLFNRGGLIRFTLDSLDVRHHPGVEVEVVVVDDGSTDKGAEVVAAEYPSVRLVRQENAGAPAARNRGIAEARAEAIQLLDSDDLVEPGFYRVRLAALRENPSADGAYGPWDHFEGTAGFDEPLVRPRHTRYPIERDPAASQHLVRLLGGWYVPSATTLWRRDALARVGGQDASLEINQDVDLMFRVLTSGAGIVGCDAPRALYRDHSGARQGVVASERQVRDLLRLRRKFRAALDGVGRFGTTEREALGRFCFDQWAAHRKRFPGIANEFLSMSQELVPDLHLPGRWPLRAASRLLGPRRALLLRDALLGERS